MDDTWQCSNCDNVNEEDRDTCRVCRWPKSPVPRPAPPDGVIPFPSAEFSSSTSWATSSSTPGSSVLVDDEPPEPVAWSRPVATGKLLGVGHAALFMTTFVFVMSEFGVGQAILKLAYFPQIAPISSWDGGPIIRQVTALLYLLPWAGAKWFYVLLCVACLIMRFARSMPGPLSLVIAIPAALYGLLAGIAEVPVFIDVWPLTLCLLALSWVIVANTLPDYSPPWGRDLVRSARLVRR
jgi:hypothetical protein